MSQKYDASVTYQGPRAEFASITGSPLWGMSVEEIIDAYKQHGWTHHSGERLPTPYGLGPMVNHFTTPQGRSVLWIPSYGMLRDEGFFTPVMSHRLFWLLWQAGVKVLLVGGTSGSNDWRDPQAEDTVRPGDFVLPWSFFRGRAMPGTLPGTEVSTGFLPRIALMEDPFCVSLSRELAEKAESELTPRPFRRVHRPQDVRVALHEPPGRGTFETAFETLTWRMLTRLMSEQEQFPHVMIFGDCISPILARNLGMHMVYYHIPSNWVLEHPGTSISLEDSLNDLYLNVLPRVCVNLEAELLQSWEIPEDCSCERNLIERPSVYMESLSPLAD